MQYEAATSIQLASLVTSTWSCSHVPPGLAGFLSAFGAREGKMGVYGGKYTSVCNTCGKLGGMLPQEILILDLLTDTIW